MHACMHVCVRVCARACVRVRVSAPQSRRPPAPTASASFLVATAVPPRILTRPCAREGDKPMALHPVTHYDRQHDSSAPGGDDYLKMLKISSADYSQRPARKQVDASETKALQQVGTPVCACACACACGNNRKISNPKCVSTATPCVCIHVCAHAHALARHLFLSGFGLHRIRGGDHLVTSMCARAGGRVP